MSFEQFAVAYHALRASVYVHKLLSPAQAREISGCLVDVERDRQLCDQVMGVLGFERMRLGRLEFYVRDKYKGEDRDHRSERFDNHHSAVARDRRATRGAALREQLERRELQREHDCE